MVRTAQILSRGFVRSVGLLLLFISLFSAPVTVVGAGLTPGLVLHAGSEQVEIEAEQQKLVFVRTEGAFVLTTFVRSGPTWRPMFDAGSPLLKGPLFNLQPTQFSVVTDTPDRKTVAFSGRHRQPDYDWTLHVDATAGSPLVQFAITCHLPEPLDLDSPQPVVALWMTNAAPAFHLDQGPDSIYGAAGIPHAYGLPAAYLWDDGREAAIFFNMTPMRWMQPDGVARFHDIRIMTKMESGQTGLGMHFKKLSGRRVPAGDLVVEFHLYQACRPRKPTGIEALDTMVRTFAPLHPAESVFPRHRLTGQPASWEQVARQAIVDLSSSQTMAEISAPWHDEPLELVSPQHKMLVHPSISTWDFSTVNNHLTPWILLARLNGDAAALGLALQKKDALPRFYDPQSRLIRHGTRQPPHVGDLEMCWQNFFFHEESLRAAAAAGPENFNPAVAGRVLMATAGLRDLGHRTDYVFPQWFDPYQKSPAVQNDIKELGVIREPWQAGAYARLMLQAFEITASPDLLAEAQSAVATLMERMDFRVQNEIYDRRYKEPADFPITELFGNAYGISAAYQLHEATRDPRFLRYSRDFMNTLLRLTFWYEDETDAVSRELHSAGLFYPHGGAHVATPWETAEAHLMIAWTLKHDREHPLTSLLLKLSNLNRINSFYFFPATWSESVLALDGKKRSSHGDYFPIEPFYSLEGTGGHRGGTACYMAGLALWNAWLYEALAEASDRDVMVLNLDALEGYESALGGVQRNFLAYNPGATKRACHIKFKHLPDDDYLVTIGCREEPHGAAVLRQGLALTLMPGEQVRLVLRRHDYRQRQRELEQERTARNRLCAAYALLQESAVSKGAAGVAGHDIQMYTGALSAYRAGRYADASATAAQVVRGSLRNTQPR